MKNAANGGEQRRQKQSEQNNSANTVELAFIEIEVLSNEV